MLPQPAPRPALEAVRLLLADRGRSGGRRARPASRPGRPAPAVDEARRALWQARLNEFTRGGSS